MNSDLRRIPGAGPSPFGPRRRGLRFQRWSRGLPSRPSVLIDPRHRRPAQRGIYRAGRSFPFANVVIGGLFVGVAGFLLHSAWSATRVDVALSGFEEGAQLTSAAAADLAVRIDVDVEALDEVAVRFDEEPVEDGLEVVADGFRWSPPADLAQGEHRLELSVPRVLLPPADFSWHFVVDDEAPRIDVRRLHDAVPIDEPVTVTGEISPDARLWVDGQRLEHDDGRFELRYDHPPAAPLLVAAEDEAGNRSTAEIITPVRYPSVRGVHVTAAAWENDELREGVLDLIEADLIDAVELDIKDEGGIVGYDSQVPLAHRIGAVTGQFDLADTVEDLHARGIRVVGRLVAFRDPLLADAAWAAGRREVVTRTPDGGRFAAYGGAMLNVASKEAQGYNLALAREAAEAGVDDILYDYIRRPDGDPASMVFTGLEGTPADALVAFLAESHRLLRSMGVHQGASVFGIAADRPDAIAQPVDRFARHNDYLAPMVYPSHWVDGEYRVTSPITMPYEIAHAALADFQAKTEGTGVALVPWLQDFTLHGVEYGPAEVRAQIDAAADLGIDRWLLWNASVRYTAAALEPLN